MSSTSQTPTGGAPNIQTIPNFRDAGGLRGHDGGRIAQGGLFRCGSPAKVSEEDLSHLQQLDFGLIADLRYVGERTKEPAPWPREWAARVATYGGPADKDAPHLDFLREGTLSIETSRQCYEQVYREVPFDPAYQAVFGRIMQTLAADKRPMLVHCSAGKDRTGMAVALIHHVLGVHRDDMVENFLQSNHAAGLVDQAETYRAGLKARFGHDVPLDVMVHALSVEAEYLDTFFKELADKAGSTDSYLKQIGFDDKARESAMAHWLDFI